MINEQPISPPCGISFVAYEATTRMVSRDYLMFQVTFLFSFAEQSNNSMLYFLNCNYPNSLMLSRNCLSKLRVKQFKVLNVILFGKIYLKKTKKQCNLLVIIISLRTCVSLFIYLPIKVLSAQLWLLFLTKLSFIAFYFIGFLIDRIA